MEKNKKEVTLEVPVQELPKSITLVQPIFNIIKENDLCIREFEMLICNLKSKVMAEVKVK